MKKIMAAALAFSVAFTVNAQEIPERKAGKPGMHRMEGKHKGHPGIPFHQLNLTDTQKEQLKKDRESFQQQMSELKKNENITVKEWKSRMENLRKEQRSKMQNILTAEQKAKLEKMKTDRKALHEVDAKARMEKMKIRLGLSDEQAAKMQKNRTEMAGKMKALRENKTLSEDKKREEMKELMKQQKEAMKSILTEEQQRKMKEGMHRGHHNDGKKPGMRKETI